MGREEAGEAGPDHKGPVCHILRERTQGEVDGCWGRGSSFVLDMLTVRLPGPSKWHLLCGLRLSREGWARDKDLGESVASW